MVVGSDSTALVALTRLLLAMIIRPERMVWQIRAGKHGQRKDTKNAFSLSQSAEKAQNQLKKHAIDREKGEYPYNSMSVFAFFTM